MRIGWAAARSGTASRIRHVALGVAALALTLTFAAVAAVFATYDGREARAAARTPLPVASAASPQARALWADKFDDVAMRQFSVIYIEPLTDDAPLPPGVTRWPAPGEAVLSKALLEAGASENIDERYGRLAGTIDTSGLATPGERLAYARPAAGVLDRASMTPISGYGAAAPAALGDLLAVKPPYMLLVLMLFMLVLPVGALAVAAARAGAEARDQRTELLDVLGGGWRVRATLNIGEALLPAASGALLGALLMIPALLTDLTLPGIAYELSATDLRNWSWAVLGSAVAAFLVMLLIVVLMHPHQRKRGKSTRPKLSASRLPRWWPYLCPLMLLLAVRGPELTPGGGTRLLVYAIGVLGTVATLPSLLALACAGAGRAIAAAGNRFGRSGALVAGRWTAAWPGTTARLTSGVIIAFVLIGQVQLWQSRNSGPAVEARATQARVGSSVVVMETPQGPKTRTDAFLQSLPTGTSTLWLTVNGSTGTAEIAGPCAGLTELALPCGSKSTLIDPARLDTRVRELGYWHTPRGAGHGLTARATAVRPNTPGGQLLILLGADGKQLSVPAVKTLANTRLATSPTIGTIGSNWLFGANLLALQSRWVLFFGAAGVLFVAAAIAIGNLSEFLRFARRMSALSVLTGRRTIFFSVSAFTLLLPLALAGIAGLTAHVWLATPLTNAADSLSFELSWSMMYAAVTGAAVLAVLVWIWGAVAAVRQSASWRPKAD
ncbi:hypothetical protein [Streptomyces sp. P9-A4]|uniref:hypothetical protein n=1 Tax=Streptomyces sp. P9-A4 TaxID=3072285 RepID=UPI002FC8624A